ncbi:MAG: hypothetical protein H6669_15720 [Ardenticatenaceae bacterium]|nr:hypothetical protein [Ardenticatenaceae bacterium]
MAGRIEASSLPRNQDQLRVIAEAKTDMEFAAAHGSPDLRHAGGGKTEVALRAAFKAVLMAL